MIVTGFLDSFSDISNLASLGGFNMQWVNEDRDEIRPLRMGTFCFLGLLCILLSFMTFASTELLTPARAELIRMNNEDLRSVNGQGLLNFVVENGSTDVTKNVNDLNGSFSDAQLNIDTTEWTYTRLETNLMISGNFTPGNEAARIQNMKLGYYDDSGRATNGSSSDVTHHDADGFCNESAGECPGQGKSFHNPDGNADWDIDVRDLFIGRSGPHQNFSKPRLKGPYVEMVWDNMQDNDPTNNKLMGFRIGLEGIQGGLTLDIPSRDEVSGFLAGQDFNDGAGINCAMHRGQAPAGDSCGNISLFSAAELGCASGESNCSDKGDNDAWTEDFWLSFNKRDVFYEFANPVLESSSEPDQNQAWAKSIDGEGFWIHATDDIEGGL